MVVFASLIGDNIIGRTFECCKYMNIERLCIQFEIIFVHYVMVWFTRVVYCFREKMNDQFNITCVTIFRTP